MSRETRAVVMVGDIPHSIHADNDAAREWLESIPEDRLTDSVTICWPVSVKGGDSA